MKQRTRQLESQPSNCNRDRDETRSKSISSSIPIEMSSNFQYVVTNEKRNSNRSDKLRENDEIENDGKSKSDASVQTDDLIINFRKLNKKRNSNIFSTNTITKISIWVTYFFFNFSFYQY